MTSKKSANESNPSVQAAKKLLAEAWELVCLEDKPSENTDIQRLIGCNLVAVRFALPTQLLGKYTNQSLDVLCLQKGKTDDQTLWDPRSFAQKTVVPWISENQNILGTSKDPYVNKPLRKPRIEAEPKDVRDVQLWKLLYTVLSKVQDDSSGVQAKALFFETLRAVHGKLKEQTFEYVIPSRVSIQQVLELITTFLDTPSGGDRGLSVAAAFFETMKSQLGLYTDIQRHVINASDSSTGLAGDIVCIGHDGEIKLAVEVKEREITLADLQSATLKARKISLQELLLNAPGYASSEADEIDEHLGKAWASGTSIYRLSIEDMAAVVLPLLGQSGIVEFITNVGKQLDEFKTQPHHRQHWKTLLESI